ncbi:atlastin-like isoform X2 [Tribolium madens]|nr:atlastin-like isoform X2 [Tribolium madens]XP_044265989.1 atlastin-like isoform X2 [Tribolium madens]XP_044265990.1 atlastin-like isoform X2 [Tribolium madens]
MEPNSLQIVNANSDRTITVDEEALRCILTKNEIKDRYLSIISIAGVFRQGKSFLLNFLLRYLRIKYLEMRDVTDWLKAEDGPLKGFSWSSGSKRHTTGIHMWSEVFLTEKPTGEKIAIILIDTQGAFDHQTTFEDCARIFAFSTLISSVQIFNVMRSIKQYDLTHLQCFGGYGSMMTNCMSVPFQNLCFLVRDWACPYEKPYGAEGGNAYLQEVFDSSEKEVKDQIENLKGLFSEMSCFLLPYPGRIVDASDTFDGNLNDIDEVFKIQVKEFVTNLLSPENVLLKTISGHRVKAEELLCYIHEYSNILKGDSLPKIDTIFKATVEAQHKLASSQAFKSYKKNMDFECRRSPRGWTIEDLYQRHASNKKKAVDFYSKVKKIDDTAVYDKYLIELKHSMDAEFQHYRKINDEKVRQYEESKRKLEERINSTRREMAGGSGMSTLGTGEKVGLAAGVIGGALALAFGASKLFNHKGSNE